MTRFSSLKTAAAALCLAVAAGTAHAAQFERASGAGDPVEAEVSVDRASRIAIEGMRIDSAVWDREEMDLQTDPKSGQIFVLPRRTGDLSLFVTTETGETAALLLHAKEEARAGNIIRRLT